MTAIKNIIFDLGGVLLNIDYDKTATAFKRLGVENFDELYSQFKANDLFERLETGNVSEKEFYETIQGYSNKKFTNEEIQMAWNAMLLNFRTDSLAFLETLNNKYGLFLLSNTNAIHYEAFQEMFKKETGKPSLDIYFKKAYYSHLIKMRKPYASIYRFVLNDIGMQAEETLFIDDSINNIEGAKELGIQTHLLLAEERIEKLGL